MKLRKNTPSEHNIATLSLSTNHEGNACLHINEEESLWSYNRSKFPPELFSSNGIDITDPILKQYEFFVNFLPPAKEYSHNITVHEYDQKLKTWVIQSEPDSEINQDLTLVKV